QAGDHVGAGRAGSTDTNADIACFGTGITFGHMRGAFYVTGQVVLDRATLAQTGVQGINRSARYTESAGNALFLHYVYGGLSRSHFCHVASPKRNVKTRTEIRGGMLYLIN